MNGYACGHQQADGQGTGEQTPWKHNQVHTSVLASI